MSNVYSFETGEELDEADCKFIAVHLAQQFQKDKKQFIQSRDVKYKPSKEVYYD